MTVRYINLINFNNFIETLIKCMRKGSLFKANSVQRNNVLNERYNMFQFNSITSFNLFL